MLQNFTIQSLTVLFLNGELIYLTASAMAHLEYKVKMMNLPRKMWKLVKWNTIFTESPKIYIYFLNQTKMLKTFFIGWSMSITID